jgi:hypothetical protein
VSAAPIICRIGHGIRSHGSLYRDQFISMEIPLSQIRCQEYAIIETFDIKQPNFYN